VLAVHPIDVTNLAKAEIYGKYADQLVRFATGLVGPNDSSDVVAAAVVRAMWSPKWDSVANERAYLYKAVLNEARMHYRGQDRRREAELQASGQIAPIQIPDVRPDVLAAVAKLSVSQRAVVFLAYWEDMRPVDIARTLGLSDGTVHRQLARAEKRLRRILHD
jgi:RNA polymerase sigma factor (sigma-70 family)